MTRNKLSALLLCLSFAASAVTAADGIPAGLYKLPGISSVAQAEPGAAAALAAVLNYWGVSVTPAELHPRGRGIESLSSVAQANGLSGGVFQGSLPYLKSAIIKGYPVIVHVGPPIAKGSSGRFLVVTGYDDESRGLFVEAAGRERFIPFATFNRSWIAAGQWTCLITPQND